MFLDEIIHVRRKCYPPSSPAGKGAKWEVAGVEHGSDWHAFDMDIQCLIEEAWARVKISTNFANKSLIYYVISRGIKLSI